MADGGDRTDFGFDQSGNKMTLEPTDAAAACLGRYESWKIGRSG